LFNDKDQKVLVVSCTRWAKFTIYDCLVVIVIVAINNDDDGLSIAMMMKATTSLLFRDWNSQTEDSGDITPQRKKSGYDLVTEISQLLVLITRLTFFHQI